MDIEGLKVLIEQSDRFNSQNFTRLEQLINAQNTRTRGTMEEIEHHLKIEIKVLKEHQVVTNGRITNSEQEIKVIKWFKSHPLVCAGIFLLVTFLANIILTVFSLRELIEFAF